MKAVVRNAVILILALTVIITMAYFFKGPVLYSLQKDQFSSQFHDNPDVLKIQSINSTTDVLPMMQELMDYNGPIVVNINLKNTEQARHDLELFSRSGIKLENLIINLDMDESEINEFSRSKARQKELLSMLMNSSISLNELESLEVQFSEKDNPDIRTSVKIQKDVIRKKLREIYEKYEKETEKIEAISQKYNLDTTSLEESRREFKKIVESNEQTAPIINNPRTGISTLSLLVKPDAGQYMDVIDISAFYWSGEIQKQSQPITFFIDDNPIHKASTDTEGVYHLKYVIEKTIAGTHRLNATIGNTASEPRSLNITAVPSKTSIILKPVSNKPEIQISGTVIANKPVRFAPVNLVGYSRTNIQLTTDKNGLYKTQMRFSPGTHWIDARFDNTSYPVFSSISSAYEIVASMDKILSFKLINVTRNADTLQLSLIPDTASYKDTINISGKLSGINPKYRNVDVFIDDAYYKTLQAGADGSYLERYVINKVRTGNHTIFTRYMEPGVGEVYSESHQLAVNSVDSRTSLEVEMIDGGTGLICTGNVTTQSQDVSSAPLELVWDDRNIINIQTNAIGSFRQQMTLPVGNHSIYARFASPDYPINSSRSIKYPVTLLPPIDLYVRPETVKYLDTLAIEGSLHVKNADNKDVKVNLDGDALTVLKTDLHGNFSTKFTVEQVMSGTHTVQVFSGDLTSAVQRFRILAVNSNLSLVASNIPDSSRIVCSGTLTADNMLVRAAPVLIIWDEQNVVETETNHQGRFEEILTLPPGKHQIRAIFNYTTQFPLNPSESNIVNIDIPRITTPGNLTIKIIPDQGRYGETLNISGTLSSDRKNGESVQIYIDGKKLDIIRTDARGIYSLQYPIERITSGVHSVHAISGNFRSEIANIKISPVDSETTLTVQQIPNTPNVTYYGHIIAENRSVSFAPVILTVDNRTLLKIKTDKSGIFTDSITLHAGTHRMQAQFNNTDIYPINPSKSTIIEINITPRLSINVKPASGIYKDILSFEGTLISPDNLEGTADLFIDNNLIATAKTDHTGRYTYKMVIENVPAGKHTVLARSANLSSAVGSFTVLPAYSQTILTITRVNNSALFECNGSVMAFDNTRDIIQLPLSIMDVLDIIATFGRHPLDAAMRPVSAAPVALIVNNVTLSEMQTDSAGRFSRVVALPTGDNVVVARFINNSFPLLTSQSKIIAVNLPSADTSPLVNTQSSPSGILVPVVLAAILLLFAGGSIFYLKRRSILFRTRQTPAALNLEPESIASSEILLKEIEAADSVLTSVFPADPDMVLTDPILTRYIRILNAQGLSTAARAVYVHFAGTIAQRWHIRNHRSLTPREFLQSCDRQPFAGTFLSFVTIYEQVRYGGAKSPDKEGEFKEAIIKTDESLAGEDH